MFNLALQVYASHKNAEVFPEPQHGIKSIGIMTCGGDCPGLNPVIRAVVLSAARKYGWKVLGIEDAMQGLINLEYKSPYGNLPLPPYVVEDIISTGGTIIGTDNKSDPFRFKLVKPDGTAYEGDVSDQVVENYKTLGLDALIVVGGDGTMRIAEKLFEKGIPLVGVPKTIDNDLLGTDQTFGFDTAVSTIASCIDKIKDTARSHDRVFIVETMGRDAGWLALHAGVAAAADVILIPEIPYTVASVVRKIETRKQNGLPFTIIVIAEGSREAEHSASVEERELGKMQKYVGAGNYLCKILSGLVDHEVRCTVLGHVQRGGSPSSLDRILGTRFGTEAVELIAQKKFGHLVSLRHDAIVHVPIRECVVGQKLVDPHSQFVEEARSIGISFGDN